jgi:hypothetical protein
VMDIFWDYRRGLQNKQCYRSLGLSVSDKGVIRL